MKKQSLVETAVKRIETSAGIRNNYDGPGTSYKKPILLNGALAHKKTIAVLKVMMDGKVRSRTEMLRAAKIDPNPKSPGGTGGSELIDARMYNMGWLDIVQIVKLDSSGFNTMKFFKINKSGKEALQEALIAWKKPSRYR